MIELCATVNKSILSISTVPKIASGSKNYISVKFQFDEEWDGMECVMACYHDIKSPFYIALSDASAHIPHEVLKSSGAIYIGVFGMSGQTTITSTVYRVVIQQGAITDNIHPSDPAPDIWEQLINQYQEMKVLCEETIHVAKEAEKNTLSYSESAKQSMQAASEASKNAENSANKAINAYDLANGEVKKATESANESALSAQVAATNAKSASESAKQAEASMSGVQESVNTANEAAVRAQDAAKSVRQDSLSASDSATAAEQARRGAETAETAARQSAAQAQKSQEIAAQAATNAGKSAQQAAGAQTAAQNSARSAGEQANAAATSAQQAQESQTAAAESATSAQESAAEATKQASASEASAVRAETAATEVEQSAQQIAGAIDRLAIHDTAAGNPTVIRDGADWQMEGLRVYGQSEQVATTGAQMFDASTRIVGGVIDNGVQASNSRYACSDYIPIPDGTTHLYQSGGALNQRGFYGVDKAYLSKPTTNNVIDVPEGAKYIRITSDIDKQDMGNIMPCVGNTAKPFEPYTGGKPAPSPEYPQEIVSREVAGIVVTGSNLLPPDDYIETATNKYFCKNTGLLLRAGVKYVFSCDGGRTNLYSYDWKSKTNVLKAYNTNQLEFAPAESGLYYFGIFNEAGITQYTNFRLNIDMKMPYEPYRAQTVKLSAPVTLRGVPVKTGGTVTIGGKQYVADLITERDGVVGIERNVIETSLTVADMNNAETHPGWKGTGITSKVKNPQANTISNVFGEHSISFNFSADIIFLAKRDMQQSEWKEKYPDLAFDIWITLAEPSFEPLPEADQQAIRALRAYHGNTVVTAGAHTEVDYIADPKLYIDGVVSTINEVKSKIIELESRM